MYLEVRESLSSYTAQKEETTIKTRQQNTNPWVPVGLISEFNMSQEEYQLYVNNGHTSNFGRKMGLKIP